MPGGRLEKADCVIALTDGGNGLENCLLDVLGGIAQEIEFALDFWHAGDHLRKFANLLISQENQFRRQVDAWRQQLKHQGGDTVGGTGATGTGTSIFGSGGKPSAVAEVPAEQCPSNGLSPVCKQWPADRLGNGGVRLPRHRLSTPQRRRHAPAELRNDRPVPTLPLRPVQKPTQPHGNTTGDKPSSRDAPTLQVHVRISPRSRSKIRDFHRC